MTKIKNNSLLRQIFYGLIAIVLLLAYFPKIASAAPIAPEKVVLGSSVASASTTYSFTFTVPTTGTAIQSVAFAACTTASSTCTPAPGFSSSSATLSNPTTTGLGGTTWAVDDTTATQLGMKESSNAINPSGSQTVNFASVTNPSATNSTFFMRITTYATSSYGTPIDTGVVAASTAGQITVTASVDQALTFTLATATIPLGVITTSTTGTGTSTMTASTNGSTGYSIAYSGTTLTSGINTITAMPSGGSTQNSSQFGMNLMLNATPAVGLAETGSGSGTPAAGYNSANSFKFLTTGDTIASATAPTNSNVYTTSYIANISGTTPAGFYSTVLTYVATANF
jgi:hypothetical protein